MTSFRPGLIYLLFALSLFFSCHNKDVVGPQGPAGPQGPQGSAGTSAVSKGNIQGQVQLFDVSGNLLQDNSGATVSLDSTSPVLQAVSATDGSFTIDSAHGGSYNISVQKSGFGTMHFFNVTNAGTPTPSQTGILSLGQQLSSQYDIKQLIVDTSNVSYGDGYYLTFTIILAHAQTIKNPVLVFFSDSTGVGNYNNDYVLDEPFSQLTDTTLVYSYSYPFSAASTKLKNANYVYLSAAIDNAKQFLYTDNKGNTIHPDAGNPSPQVILNNVLHKY